MKQIKNILLILILGLYSCSPVTKMTRVNSIPREFRKNYSLEGEKAPKNMARGKKAWIVFSDKDKNPTYVNPGGKIELKKCSFMEALAVIDTKGDYFEVVRFSEIGRAHV